MAKKAGRFQKDKQARAKQQRRRGALSLEEAPLEDYQEEEEAVHFSISKPMIRVLLILLACGLALVLWINREHLSPDRISDWAQDTLLGMGAGAGYPHPIAGSEVTTGNFQLMEKDLVMVSDTSFVALNRTAKELCNRQHSFGSPILKVQGSRALVYNLGGNALTVETRSKTVLKRDKLDNKILAGAISDSGIYAVVTESKGYLGELTVYPKTYSIDKPDEYLYKYWFADYYITDLALNKSGSAAAAVGMSTSGGALNACLYLFDFTGGSIETKEPDYTFENNLILSVTYLNNGSVAVVGEHMTSIISPATGERVDYDYNQRTLASYEAKEDGVLLALSKSNDGRACDVVRIGQNGKVEGEFSTALKAISVARCDDMIAVLSGGMLYGFSNDGKPLGSWDAGSDARKVLLYDAKDAYVLGVSEARTVTLSAKGNQSSESAAGGS